MGKSSAANGLKSRFSTPLCHEGYILVDRADKEISNKKGESIPRLEIVDPNELSRRRALEDLSQQQIDKKIAADTIKTVKVKKRPHSSSNARKTHTSSKKKKGVKKVVKRVKDLFDD